MTTSVARRSLLCLLVWLVDPKCYPGARASTSSLVAEQYPDCMEEISWISNGFCDVYQNIEECGYDGGDCCLCTCVDSTDHMCGDGGYACFDPTVPASCVEESASFVAPTQGPYVPVGYTSLYQEYLDCADVGVIFLIGDGYCDRQNNRFECDYDGGDCCSCTCDPDGAAPCGVVGFNCKDPTVSETCVEESESYIPPDSSDHNVFISHLFPSSLFERDEYSMCFDVGGFVSYIGDGACDEFNSNEECNFDGGDCCSCTCEDTAEYTCGDFGYTCQDPEVSLGCMEESASFIPPNHSDVTELVDTGDCYDIGGYPPIVGDGDCDVRNNNHQCAYDGGDCCSCTCVDTELYTCGSRGGYLCRDPTVPDACVEESNTYDPPTLTELSNGE